MNLLPNPSQAPLDQLIQVATNFSDFTMRHQGRVPPTFLAQTQEGLIAYFPERMGDERAKDNFAQTARLISIAHEATAIVMILESWVKLALDLVNPLI